MSPLISENTLHFWKYLSAVITLVLTILLIFVEIRDKKTKKIIWTRGILLLSTTLLSGSIAIYLQYADFNQDKYLKNPLDDFSFNLDFYFPDSTDVAALVSSDRSFSEYINRINKIDTYHSVQFFDVNSKIFPLKREKSLYNLLINNQAYIKIFQNFNKNDSIRLLSLRPNIKGDIDFNINTHGITVKDSLKEINLEKKRTIYNVNKYFVFSFQANIRFKEIHISDTLRSALQLPGSTIIVYLNTFLPYEQMRLRQTINPKIIEKFKFSNIEINMNGKNYMATVERKNLGSSEFYIGVIHDVKEQ